MRIKTTHRIVARPNESIEITDGHNEVEISTTDEESVPEIPIADFVLVIPKGMNIGVGRGGRDSIIGGPIEVFIMSDEVVSHFDMGPLDPEDER